MEIILFSNYRIVCVTPAGRKKYLEILLRYVISNKNIIDSWELWLNTEIQPDIEYIDSLERQFPGFISVVRIQTDKVYDSKQIYKGYHVEKIHLFFRHCVDEKTIYIRLDDDIVFVEKNAIENLLKCRIEYPDPFLIYGNIVNNAICNFMHQRFGILSNEYGICGINCMDTVGWLNPKFALYTHSKFIELYKENKLNRYTIIDNFNSFERFSINVICWFGKEFAKFGGNVGEDEEQWLTEDYPRQVVKYSTICGNSLFTHFSFYIQRNFLESIPQLLETYQKIALKENV
jgi:hypothetical protein